MFPPGFPLDRQPADHSVIPSAASTDRVMGARVPAEDRHRRRWCEISSRQRLTYQIVTGASSASPEIWYDNGGTVVERFVLGPDQRVQITTQGNANAGHVAYWLLGGP